MNRRFRAAFTAWAAILACATWRRAPVPLATTRSLRNTVLGLLSAALLGCSLVAPVGVAGVASGSAETSVALALVPDHVPSNSSLSSNAGGVGHSITLTGANFKNAWGATPTVYFNGTAATPTSASNTAITVAVPPGATTGSSTLTATSRTAPGKAVSVNITISDFGDLVLGVQ